MEYTNPEIPEGINASLEHPLKEFFWLTASVLVAGLAVILIVMGLADLLSDRIPFRVEKELTAKYITAPSSSPEMDEYLNALAAKLSAAQGVPKEITLRVHYSDDEMVNALATLGGNIFMFRGLLEKLPNENALAMVLAHEIAHVKHRDPIRGMSRAVVIGLSLSMLSVDAGEAVLGPALSQGAMLTLMKYSRDQENAADDAALATLNALYGHADGAEALFDVLQSEHGESATPEFFSTHPLTADRLTKVREASPLEASERSVTALPEGFHAWMKAPAGKDETEAAAAR